MKIVSILMSGAFAVLLANPAQAALPDPGGCHLETIQVSHNVYVNDRVYFVLPRQRAGEIPTALSIPTTLSTDEAALERPELRLIRFDEADNFTYGGFPLKIIHQDFSDSRTEGNYTYVRTVYWNLVRTRGDDRFRIRLTDIRDVYAEIEICTKSGRN